tara:strand:+ start:759 stop:1349 length:591 start_codon:yes stop_codon:yes gene_type:complete
MSKRAPGLSWWLLALFATAIGGYGVLMIDARGAKNSVPGLPWIDEVHFVTGGLALILGVWGFRRDLLAKRRNLHRRIGKLYMLLVLLSGTAGAAMACFSMAGMVAHLGFGLLAIAWLVTTFLGWHRIHKLRDVIAHRRWMVRSYALTCAAITLRLQLGPLAYAFEGFLPAYKIVSWSAWLPNMIFAEWWLRRYPNP